MAGIIQNLAEKSRQLQSGDTNWFKKGLFMFVLRGPGGVGPIPELGRAQFPLVINPQTYNYRMPFAAEVTPLQEGGIAAEENGIVLGEIELGGTTGFRLRNNINDTSASRGEGEFTGLLDPGGRQGQAAATNLLSSEEVGGLSGQMHFWRLAGRCFDGYSALKKDPRYAHLVRMEFHDIKNNLHLAVIPQEFEMIRNAESERVTYRYRIRLMVTGAAESDDLELQSPDVGLLQSARNTVAEIRSAVQSVQASVDNLTAAQDEVRRTVLSMTGIISDVANILNAANDFLEGTKRFFDIPASVMVETAGLVNSAANLTATTTGLPASLISTQLAAAAEWRNVEDGIDRLKVAARDHFSESFDDVVRQYERMTSGYQRGRDSARDTSVQTLQAEADANPGRLTMDRVFGGSASPGDINRGIREIQVRFQGRFVGFQERVVGQGDTVQSLAAKYMGDARDWPAIVIANRLRPPYITDGAPMPNTVHVGESIVIPIPQSLRTASTFTTGNATRGSSQIEAQLGVDFERVRLDDGTFGWAIDTAAGAVDARKVRGLACLEQGLDGRWRTEQGFNILYPRLGLPRVVGSINELDNLANQQYAARAQILADPRVDSLVSLQLTAEGDTISIDANVKPVGFTSSRPISRTL